MSSSKTRYRKIEVGTWVDRRFRELSAPAPNARTLWLYLLCGPRTTIFPGLITATDAVIASDLGWPLNAELDFDGSARGSAPGSARGSPPRALRECWIELAEKGMAKGDFASGVIVLPKALMTSSREPRETAKPSSPNVFKGWFRSWSEVPDCDLKDEYLTELIAFAKALGSSYSAVVKHYASATTSAPLSARSSAPRALPQSLGYQEQEQDLLLGRAPDSRLSDPGSAIGSSSSGASPDPEQEVTREHDHARDRDGMHDLDAGNGARGIAASNTADDLTSSRRLNDSHGDAIAAAPETIARRTQGHRVWDRLNALRRELATELGLAEPMFLHDQHVGRGHLADRLREAGSASAADLEVEHAFAVATAEARDQRTLKWMGPGMFKPDAWSRLMTMDPADVGKRARRPDERNVFDEVDRATEMILAAQRKDPA